jgi:hypothetical protein
MQDDWEKEAACIDWDTNLFFDKYEEDLSLRPQIDEYCMDCPVMKQCFAVGVSKKAWGVRGGIYFENGKISREFNRHKSKSDWSDIWQRLTIEKES